MKLKLFFCTAFLFGVVYSEACTNFIVGKKASVDGSVITSYNADDYGMFANLCHFPAGTHAKGEMRMIIDWDTKVLHGEIPEAPVTYNVIGNINEYQVTIGETTYGGREEMVDTTSILDYGSLIYIGMQRAKTAREAIKVMTSLAERYGYCSEGETFTIADPNEAWIMEMMGKGVRGKGAVWVAVRVPDDCICAHANQSRIHQFNMKDTKNVIYSKDVINFARSKGWFKGKDVDFSFCDTYAPANFEGRRFCEARVWSFFNRFDKTMNRYLAYAEGKEDGTEAMPLFLKPDRKVSVQDVMTAMRDHYEDTPFALDKDLGEGPYGMPYRPTPLVFTVDSVKYFNERPTSTQQTGFSFVSQMRSWLPRQIGGILWFGNDDANMIAYTPIYCGSSRQPECYNTPNADAVTFNWNNAYWVCNWVSNMTYPRYSMLFPSVKTVRDSLEQSYFANQKEIENKAIQMYAESQDKAVSFLNDYSVDKAQQMLACWQKLGTYLVVKFNDMIIKPEVNGVFKRTSTGLGATPVRPGYPTKYARKIVQQTGDRFKYPVGK
ncbi:MAG: C69 family dipeptidase [Prevotella sp.]|nr:C69 family dipeptidase [Prevotella sp.]